MMSRVSVILCLFALLVPVVTKGQSRSDSVATDFERDLFLEELASSGGLDDEFDLDGEIFEVGEQSTSATKPRGFLRGLFSDLRGMAYSRVSRKLKLGSGFDNQSDSTTSYSGGPIKHYHGLALSTDHLNLNITLENDAGESFGWSPGEGKFGFDFASTSVGIEDVWRINKLILGNYTASFGTGLVLGPTVRAPKGQVARTRPRLGSGIKPHRSTEENRFLTGIGLELNLIPRTRVAAFYSDRWIDASRLTDADGKPIDLYTSVFGSGLHRTVSEKAKRHRLRETVRSTRIELTFNDFQLGLVGLRGQFSSPVVSGDQTYQLHNFSGRRYGGQSVFFRINVGRAQLLGEVAQDLDGRIAYNPSIALSVSNTLRATMLYRKYPVRYHAVRASAVGERSGAPQNESGLLIGAKYTPTRRVTIFAQGDVYRIPWARFALSAPSSGFEYSTSIDFRPREWIGILASTQAEQTSKGATRPSGYFGSVKSSQDVNLTKRRLQLDYAFGERFTTRLRADWTRFEDENGVARGSSLLQDYRLVIAHWFRLDARWMIYSSDDHNTRIYAYEKDVAKAFSIPSFSGSGLRSYLLLTATPWRGLTIQFKIANTARLYVDELGSGLDTVAGGRQTEFRLQVMSRW